MVEKHLGIKKSKEKKDNRKSSKFEGEFDIELNSTSPNEAEVTFTTYEIYDGVVRKTTRISQTMKLSFDAKNQKIVWKGWKNEK